MILFPSCCFLSFEWKKYDRVRQKPKENGKGWSTNENRKMALKASKAKIFNISHLRLYLNLEELGWVRVIKYQATKIVHSSHCCIVQYHTVGIVQSIRLNKSCSSSC